MKQRVHTLPLSDALCPSGPPNLSNYKQQMFISYSCCMPPVDWVRGWDERLTPHTHSGTHTLLAPWQITKRPLKGFAITYLSLEVKLFTSSHNT